MNKFVFIIAFIGSFAVSQSYAQIEKGKILLGGSGSITRDAISSNNYSIIQINPTFGNFVGKKIALGSEFVCSYVTSPSNKAITIGFMPLVRYYFLTTENSAMFGHAAFGFVQESSRYSRLFDSGKSSNTSSLGIFGIGYTYFLNKSIGLESILNCKIAGGDTDGGSLGIDVGFQIYLGKNE
jgi:hypothetical protein